MLNNIKDLIANYQIRKTYDQKSDFIAWYKERVADLGYDLKIEKTNKSRNLVIGDLENADVVFTAHYDTQPNSIIPIVTYVSNIFTYIISQILSLWPILLYLFVLNRYILFSDFALNLYPLLYIALLLTSLLIPLLLLFQMSFGFANKHTLNDNTSGVATILHILENLDDNRSKVAFILFDDEEKGLVGSSFIKNKYNKTIQKTLLINFDCVGDGSDYLFVTKKAVRESSYYNSLSELLTTTAKPSHLKRALVVPYMSDQLWFKESIGVVSVKRRTFLGYYLNRIHTRKDTIFQYENIEDLSRLSIELIKYL